MLAAAHAQFAAPPHAAEWPGISVLLQTADTRSNLRKDALAPHSLFFFICVLNLVDPNSSRSLKAEIPEKIVPARELFGGGGGVTVNASNKCTNPSIKGKAISPTN